MLKIPSEQQFKWDIFLSYSSHNKEQVQEVAQHLADQGLRVWFDDWIVRPGDNIPLMIEHGLQDSRDVLLFMSKDAIRSDWVTLERQTAIFRDPANKGRRLIPILLDDSELPDTIRCLCHIDWRAADKTRAYRELSQTFPRVRGAGMMDSTFYTVFTPGRAPLHPELLVGRDAAIEQLK